MGVGDQMKKTVAAAVDKGIGVQQPTVENYIARAKQRNPSATPSEVIASLERQYLSAVIALGGASGASVAAPAVGTGAGLIVNIAEVGAFLEASALFCLAVSEVHGVQIHDLERRRTLLMGVLMGNGGSRFVEKVAGRTGTYWAKSLVKAIPMARIDAVNKVLGPRFITKYGTKQGVLVLGRDLPFGIGAVIGAGGNAALGRMAVSGTRRAFGPPPQDWPSEPPPPEAERVGQLS
jgi:hypothetical protein